MSNSFLSEGSFWTICDILDFLYESERFTLSTLELCQNGCVLEDEEIYRLLRSAVRVRSLGVLCLTGNEANVRDLDGRGTRQHRLQQMVRLPCGGSDGRGGRDGRGVFVNRCCNEHAGACCSACRIQGSGGGGWNGVLGYFGSVCA